MNKTPEQRFAIFIAALLFLVMALTFAVILTGCKFLTNDEIGLPPRAERVER